MLEVPLTYRIMASTPESGTSYTDKEPPVSLSRKARSSDHVGCAERRSVNTEDVVVEEDVEAVGREEDMLEV